MKKKKIYKSLLIVLVFLYTVFTLINQQKLLMQYDNESQQVKEKIEEQQEYNDKLIAEKDNVNSKEFIEEMARDELDMYYPNEKIYMDKGM